MGHSGRTIKAGCCLSSVQGRLNKREGSLLVYFLLACGRFSFSLLASLSPVSSFRHLGALSSSSTGSSSYEDSRTMGFATVPIINLILHSFHHTWS